MFRAFLKTAPFNVTAQQIIRDVYGISNYEDLSKRHRVSLQHNVVKLVSRARKVCETAFPPTGPYTVNWLPWDTVTKSWKLMQIRQDLEISHWANVLL